LSTKCQKQTSHSRSKSKRPPTEAPSLVPRSGLVVISRANRGRWARILIITWISRRGPIPVLLRRCRPTRRLIDGTLVAHSNAVNSLAPVLVNSSLVKNAANSIALNGRAILVAAVRWPIKIASVRSGDRRRRQATKRHSKDSMAHGSRTHHS
jgi:hypothetical protein